MWVRFDKKMNKYRFVEYYNDALTGKKREVSVSFDRDTPKTRKAALELLNSKIEKAGAPKSSELSLSDLVEEYLSYLELSAKPSTCLRYKFALGACVDLLGGSVIADRITSRYIREKFIKSKKENITLNGYLRYLKTFYHWAYKNDLIPSTAAVDKVDYFDVSSKKERLEDKFMESSELRELLDRMNHPVWSLLTEFLALSGLRSGEAIALLRSDVDFDSGIIRVNKTYDPVTRVLSTTKTAASSDDVVMQPELASVVRRINSYMLAQQMRFGYRSKLLFSSRTGGYINYHSFNRYFKSTTQAVLGRPLTAHSLRHTHASLLFEHGFTLDEVSRRLRHADSKITKDVYIHVTKRLRENDAKKLRCTTLL